MRFVKEYAYYKKRWTDDNVTNPRARADVNQKIDRALLAFERGLITTDETMKLIAEA